MADHVRVLHNPRCSKSRQALALLAERGVEPEVVRYLDSPPSRAELEVLLDQLVDEPADLVRSGDAAFRDAGLRADQLTSRDRVLDVLETHPALLQRPVVVVGDRAVIARPPERGLELLEGP
jgi:arsenate reductase